MTKTDYLGPVLIVCMSELAAMRDLPLTALHEMQGEGQVWSGIAADEDGYWAADLDESIKHYDSDMADAAMAMAAQERGSALRIVACPLDYTGADFIEWGYRGEWDTRLTTSTPVYAATGTAASKILF